MTTTAAQYQFQSLTEAQLMAQNPVLPARVLVIASDTLATWFGDGTSNLQNLRKGSLIPQTAGLTGDRVASSSADVTGTITIPGTGSAVLNRRLTGAVSVVLPTNPASDQSFTVTLVLEQDSTGGRNITWPTGLLWPNGNAPVLTQGAGKIDQFRLRWTGSRWLGFPEGASFGVAAVATTKAFYSDTGSGTNGSAPRAAWSIPYGGVTIQNNKITLNPGAASYSAIVEAIVATPDNTNGSTATGVPPTVTDLEYTFDMSLADLGEQYPIVGVRVRGRTYQNAPDDLWQGGGGNGLFKTGYSIVMGPAAGVLDVVRGYDTTTLDHKTGIVYPNKDMTVRVKWQQKGLYVRIWAKGTTEPTAWTYSNDTVLDNLSSGTIGFAMGNGSAATAKTLGIGNLVALTPIITPGPTTTAPTTAPSGFTQIFREDFATAAPAGTGTGGFIPTYANSFQPYNDEGSYFPRAMISAHDGYMDVALDGARGSAGTFGSPSNAYNRVGGRFVIRAMATDGHGNGTAVIIWPTSEVWTEGELDYPEANFEDMPWVHHHKMVQGQEGSSTDIPTGVDWRRWHTYEARWYPPGKGPTPATGSVEYYVDGVMIGAPVTIDVPTTAHRFMFQVGNYGNPGHMLIDWITIDSLN